MLLKKWSVGEAVNTLPSQGNIHGFKSRTDHHLEMNWIFQFFAFYSILCYYIIYKWGLLWMH